MALNVFELFGTIAVDNSGAERSIDKTVGHARDAESKLEKTFKRIGTVVAAAFAIDKIVDFGKACTQAYASIAAEESAFAQIMGDYAGTAQKKLQAVSDATGVTSTRLTGAMTSLTAKFKGLGYNVEDATTLATDGLLIASDAAAFWDMSLEESMSHLNSFINGSYEGGEAIGLFANDTQMAAYAVEKGIVKDAKAWASLDEATKQATRLDYAKNMQQQSGATGQAAKEASSYANVMANLKEHWRQFQGVVGKPILEKFVLPAMQKLEKFMPKLTESVTAGIDWLAEGFDKIASYFTEVFTEDGLNMDALPDALTKMFQAVRRKIPQLLSTVGHSIRSAWANVVWPAVQGAFKAVLGVDLPDWSTLKQRISDGWNNQVWPSVQGFFTKQFGITLPKWTELKNKIVNSWTKTVWPAIKGFFTKPFGITLPSWTDLKTRISNSWTKTVWPAIKGFFTKPFDITLPKWTELKTKITNSWTKTVWPAVQGFFTKQFSITLPSWTDLKDRITNSWTKTVWPAIKGFFTKPFGITLPSWTDLKDKITNSWTKTVWPAIKGFFTKPFGITLPSWTDLKDKISNSWTKTVWPAIKGFFTKPFGITLPSWTDLKAKISNSWTKTVWPAIKGFFTKPFGITLPSWTDLKAKISNSWTKTVWPAIKGFFTKPFGITMPTWTDVKSAIEQGWETIRADVEKTFDIDLSGIDIAGIFTAGETAINSLITTAQDLVNKLLSAVASNPNGEIVLSATLTNLFKAGVDAIFGLIGDAGMLVANVVGAITGNQKQAEDIGKVFSELFGLASETIKNVTDAATGIFQWFLTNGDNVKRIIAGVAGAFAGFLLANPAIAALTALTALVTVLVTDWDKFEENYPELATMLEDLTGLDFTDVANSLTALQDGLKGIVEFVTTNRNALNVLLLVLGAIALHSGNVVTGTALIAAGSYEQVWKAFIEKSQYSETPEVHSDYEHYDQDEITEGYGGLLSKWGEDSAATIESYWDSYRSALKNGTEIPAETTKSFLSAIETELDKMGATDPEFRTAYISDVIKALTRLSPDNEDLPEEWYERYLDGTPTGKNGMFGELSTRGNKLPGDSTGQTGLIGTLAQVFSTVKADITAAAQEGVAAGMSGITITGHITTGDVTLDGKTVAGHIWPQLDMKLGWQNGLAGRGNA